MGETPGRNRPRAWGDQGPEDRTKRESQTRGQSEVGSGRTPGQSAASPYQLGCRHKLLTLLTRRISAGPQMCRDGKSRVGGR